MRQSAGVYVHFPWCLAKCPYCDFVSYGTERASIDHAAYADAVVAELGVRAACMQERRVESVFFGGGTPSLWEPAQLGRVLEAIRTRLPCAPDGELEITVECNPTSLDAEGARALAAAGVNRLSVGVQSLDPERLRYLGRLHDPAGARRAVADALGAVGRVSADLIFGLPGQSPEQAVEEATSLAAWGLDHLSCYQLTIEPGTRFGELARRGRLPLADDGAVAEAFVGIDEALGARGYRHYEISNYARPGQEARHNLGYWRGDEYLGLGCAAYGFVTGEDGRRMRYRNETLPDRYVRTWLDPNGAGAPFDKPGTTEPGAEIIDADTHARERIMLGLRVAEGVDLAGVLTPEREQALAWLEGRGRVVRDGTRVRIPPSAWLWADDTAARLF